MTAAMRTICAFCGPVEIDPAKRYECIECNSKATRWQRAAEDGYTVISAPDDDHDEMWIKRRGDDVLLQISEGERTARYSLEQVEQIVVTIGADRFVSVGDVRRTLLLYSARFNRYAGRWRQDALSATDERVRVFAMGRSYGYEDAAIGLHDAATRDEQRTSEAMPTSHAVSADEPSDLDGRIGDLIVNIQPSEAFGAPPGCVCTWLVHPTFVGAPLVERGRGAMPCSVHPDAAAPDDDEPSHGDVFGYEEGKPES